MSSIKSKPFKFALKAGTILLALIFLLLLLVLLPPVQNKIISIVTQRLSEKLETTVTIDRFYLNFVDEVCLQGLYIEDQHRDTLVYSESLYADFAFWKLLGNTVEVNDIEFYGTRIKLREDSTQIFNFQFLLDAFESTDTLNETESAMTINLDEISLLDSDIDFVMQDQSVSFNAEDVTLNVSLFDLEESKLEFDRLNMDGIDLKYIYARTNNESIDIEESTFTEFPFKDFPYELSFKEISIIESNALYSVRDAQNSNSFESDYINLRDLTAHLKDVNLSDKLFKTTLSQLVVNVNNHFQVDKLQTNIEFSDNRLELSNTSLLAGNNAVNADLNLRYRDFNELVNFDSSMGIDLALQESQLIPVSLGYFVPSIYETESLDSYISKPFKFQGQLEGTLKEIDIKNLLLDASQSKLIAKGVIENMLDLDYTRFDGVELVAEIGHLDYKAFVPDRKLRTQLEKIGKVNIDMSLNGSLETVYFNDFNLDTESLFGVHLNGRMSSLLDPTNLSYQVDIDELKTGKGDAIIFLDTLPTFFDDLDTVKYSGTLTGNLNDISMDGEFITNLGPVKSNLAILFEEDYSDASYSGEIETKDFDVGRLLDQDSLGRVSMDIQLDGSGLDADSIKTYISGTIQEVTYNNYSYRQLRLDGSIDGRSFLGTAGIDDKNLKFNFDGSVDLNDSIPDFRFDMILDTVSLKALNLSSKIFNLSANVQADFSGYDLDNIVGELKILDVFMAKSKKSTQTDSILFSAKSTANKRELLLTSEFGKAEVTGDYKLALLDDAVLDFFDRYFPMKTFLGRSPKTDSILNSNELRALRSDVIDAHFEVFNIAEIGQFFDYPLEYFDTSFLDFKLEIPADLAEFSFFISEIIYDGYFVDSIYLEAKNQGKQLISDFRVDSISVTESIHSSGIEINALFEDQSARIKTMIKNNDNIRGLGFSNLIKAKNSSQFSLQFIDQFILNDKLWNVQQDSNIVLSNEVWDIPYISISNGNENLGVQGSTERLITDFDNFDIKNLVDIIGLDSLDASGIMDGDLKIGLNSEIPLEGNLTIRELLFNEYELGTVDLSAIKRDQMVDMKLNAIGPALDFKGAVYYDLDLGNFQGQLLVSDMDLEPYNPLLSSYFTGLKGKLTGDAFIEGTIDKPLVTGVFNFENVTANFVPLSTKYSIQTGTITLFDKVIQPNITLVDEKSRTSYLDGSIYHQYFEDLQFDLTFDAEAFTFLDSPADKNELFYGKFVGKVYAEITGDADIPIVYTDVQALSETDLTVQILASESTLIEEDYIVFYDQNKVGSASELDSFSRNAYQTESSVDLNLRLSTTPEALYHIIVDPLTGDRLDIRGEGDLIVVVPNEEPMSIIGELEVVDGNYRLSYENIVRRNFALDPGSSIVFTGDPYNARLDMRALYKTSTNTYSLVQNMTSTINDGSVSNKTLVEIVLYIMGTISKPELSFDIQIPESSTSPVGSNVTTALANIRQSETLLLEQVFSLILFNSFTSSNSNSNFSNVGTSAAISSVGSLINSQLNRLTKSTNGLELNFALDQYQDQESSTNSDITEVNLGVQQKLFNDRLILSAGGNANLGITQDAREFSRVAGDFVVTYIFTEDGRYRVKVFQKSDFDAISTSSVWRTGVGVSYKNKFGKINKSKSVKGAN